MRRALLTDVSQLSAKISEYNAEQLDTDVVEVTAHAGARPDHAKWQGGWYSISGKDETYNGVTYKDIVKATGHGTGAGLMGWNCRHSFFPVIPGIDKPKYTKKELENIDPPPKEIDGEIYTYYEAEQQQRYMERIMRKTKRELVMLQAAGDEEQFIWRSILLRGETEEYVDFCEKAGLIPRPDRYGAVGYGRVISSKAKWSVRKSKKDTDILNNPHIISETSEIYHKNDLTHTGNGDIITSSRFERAGEPLSAEYISVLENRYNSGTEIAKKVYDKYVPDGNRVINIHLDNKETPYFGVGDISINETYDLNNKQDAGQVWFHEHGHYIDWKNGLISCTEEFAETIKEDVRNLEMNMISEMPDVFKRNLTTEQIINNARICIGAKLKGLGVASLGVQDILGGVIGDRYPKSSCYHDKEYWETYGDAGLCKETFANMFEASFSKEKRNVMEIYLPNTWKKFNEMLEGLI